MMSLLAAADPLVHVLPHPVLKIGSLTLSNQMIMALVAAILMVLIFPALFRRATAEAPTGARNFFESILEFLRVEVFRPALKENTDRFVPFLWTLFFFILFCNLLGLIPFPQLFSLIFGEKAKHWGGTATGNINMTGALAICAFLSIHANGIIQVAKSLMQGTYGQHGHHEEHSADGKPGHEAAIDLEHVRGEGLPADVPQQVSALASPTRHYADGEHVEHHHAEPDHGQLHGHGGAPGPGMNPLKAALLAVPLYLWNFAPHPFRPEPGEPSAKWIADVPVWGMLLVLELIGAVIKPFALMVRLFANMLAGHLVLAVLVGFIPVGVGILHQLGIAIPVVLMSLMIMLLELFVAFLQAYIFTFLTTLFLASAVAPEH